MATNPVISILYSLLTNVTKVASVTFVIGISSVNDSTVKMDDMCTEPQDKKQAPYYKTMIIYIAALKFSLSVRFARLAGEAP